MNYLQNINSDELIADLDMLTKMIVISKTKHITINIHVLAFIVSPLARWAVKANWKNPLLYYFIFQVCH